MQEVLRGMYLLKRAWEAKHKITKEGNIENIGNIFLIQSTLNKPTTNRLLRTFFTLSRK